MYTGYNLVLTKEKAELLINEYKTNNSTNQYYGSEEEGILGKSPAYREISRQMKDNIAACVPSGDALPEWDAPSESPIVKADIFLAHSEKDGELARALADWMSRNFNVRVFLGTWFDKHSRRMQDEIKNRAGSENLPLDKIQDIEDVAVIGNLMKIIDTTECFIFLNTENAMADMDPVVSQSDYSGRLYFEILVTSLIRRSLSDRQKLQQKRLAKVKLADRPKIKSIPACSHLLPMTGKTLDAWYIKYGQAGIVSPMDLLYEVAEETR